MKTNDLIKKAALLGEIKGIAIMGMQTGWVQDDRDRFSKIAELAEKALELNEKHG